MFKRVLATVLTILMLLSVIPATLASAATIPGSLIQPSYYMDDNNDVRWYYFELSGWYFWYGYGYSDSMTDYAALNPGASAPTNGYIYVYGTDAHLGAAMYSTEGGWEITGTVGGAPGQGGGVTMSNYTLIDNNGATWKHTAGGWAYVPYSFWGATGTLSEYFETYRTYPQSGTIKDVNKQVCGYAVFSTTTYTWSTSTNGGFAYTIFDGRATWYAMFNEWVFVATLTNGQSVSGNADDYKAAFGEYPSTGTATDGQGNFISYCVFDEYAKSWRNSTGPNTGTINFDYIIDNNNVHWVYNAGVWYYVKSDNTYGTVSEYIATYNRVPTSGDAYTAQGSFVADCSFDFQTYSWITKASDIYILDNWGVRWVQTDAGWRYVQSNGSFAAADTYFTSYRKHPTGGQAFNSEGHMVGTWRFDSNNGTWVEVNNSSTIAISYIIDNFGRRWVNNNSKWKYIKPDNTYGTVLEYVTTYSTFPDTGVAYNAQDVSIANCFFTSSNWYVSDYSSTPGTGILNSYYILDNNNVAWYYRNNVWCFQTSTGFGGISEYLMTYGLPPMSGTLYSSDNVSMGVYLFNTSTYTWESIGGSVIPDGNNPGTSGGSSSGSGSVSDGYYSGQLADPNTARKVYDTKNYLWTKTGSTWSSLNSSYYTVANPARYIDSTNRVWEMRNSRWVLNEYATPDDDEVVVPPASSQFNPNNITSLTDTKGYVWTKSGAVWTSTAASYYSVLNVTPEYKAADNTIWYLNAGRTTWTKATGGSQTPSTPTIPVVPESVAGYTAYVFDGKTYQVPNHTIEIVPGPTTMPYKPEGYNWITHGGKYTLMNLNTGDIYPIPTLYQLPNNYYYQPTYDKENPWKIVGNGTFANSTITSIELTDYPYKLEVGKTYQCKAEYVGGSKVQSLSTILIWSSTNPEVATVDQTGKVTIVGVGRADIKVRAFLGFVETKIDIYGIEAENKPEDKPSTPVTPPDEPVTPPVVTTPVSDIFSDVSANAPYTEYIQYVYDNDIFKGMSETTFGPESTMTRAQFYTVLARMAGYTDEELKAKYPSTKFADSQDKWFTAAVEWAYTEGLDGGVGAMQIADANGQLVWVDNCFNPDGAIKREDACAALYNFAKKYNKAAYAQLVQQPYNISFADASEVNWWTQAAVSSFSQLGILSGHILDSGNNFRPEDPTTRSDIATIIARYGMLYMK